jgi:hypothetical protein
MAQLDEMNTETIGGRALASDPRWDIIGAVALAVLIAFSTVVMMMVEGGGPQDFVGRGVAYSAAAAVVGAALCLPGIYKKAGPMAFLSSGMATVCVITLAAASFAFV